MKPLSIELERYSTFIHVRVLGCLTYATVKDFYARFPADLPPADIPRLIDFREVDDYDVDFAQAGLMLNTGLKAMRGERPIHLKRVFLATDKWVFANLRMVATRAEDIEHYEVHVTMSEEEALEFLGAAGTRLNTRRTGGVCG